MPEIITESAAEIITEGIAETTMETMPKVITEASTEIIPEITTEIVTGIIPEATTKAVSDIISEVMANIINWCNLNNGFLTAILSLVGLLISTVAIIVSINTARLPYKKNLKLSSSLDIEFSKNIITGEVSTKTRGISVNAANIGSRNVNITYLGIAIKGKSSKKATKKMTKIKDDVTGIGLISPTEVKTEEFKKVDLLNCLSTMCDKHDRIFLYAHDTEGQEYFAKSGTVEKMIENLSK